MMLQLGVSQNRKTFFLPLIPLCNRAGAQQVPCVGQAVNPENYRLRASRMPENCQNAVVGKKLR